jgi:iron complex transport system substrate-binding protein
LTQTRRAVLASLATALVPAPALARRTIVDSAGRQVVVPVKVERVFPAGPPAAIKLYSLASDMLIGWPRANRPDEREYLDPVVGARPEIGRLTGRGNTANLEAVLRSQPDLILDSGSLARTFVELADQVQRQTGIPYALLDGRFPNISSSYRTLGELLGVERRAQELGAYADDAIRSVLDRVLSIPELRRPRVYYARGPAGLETGLLGSINVEIFEFMGVRNVASDARGGLATVSLEQVLRWNPEVIITIDQTFASTVYDNPSWASVRAVQARRVYLSPKLPFGWVDFPPGINRLIGMRWLGKVIYPETFPEDIRAITREFYDLFYHVKLTDAHIDRVLSGRL